MSDDRYERGRKKFEEINPGASDRIAERLKDIAPDFIRYIDEFIFGDIFSRPGLDLKSRQIAIVAALTCLGNARPQLKAHIHNSLNVGWTRQEIVEVIMQMAIYGGFPVALNGFDAAKEVFQERDALGQS